MANSEKSLIDSKVAVIGAGVMGEALISALITYGVKPTNITISEKREERAAELIARYKVANADLATNVAQSDLILLVVKPQDMATVLAEIAPVISKGVLVISFVAGKQIRGIADIIGTSANPVIRVMPNTPTLVGAGMSAISCCALVSPEQKAFTLGFLGAVGKVIEVDEDLQDAVTATSGSGPAYFFRFVEAMVDGAVALGLSQEDATTLTIQTIVGAAKLLDQSGDSPTTLREKVTSPNGTTFAALNSFNDSDISATVAKAMKAARDRSQELA
ncbi:pyrroline-5-carboxylate reductase [Candidatus Planktophila lacus]|uniref:pyrroline-5-carboxylate reductase n=1 Tax=Candidatus Planktophila lacus TaxID=1884913 RepID=UPI000BACBF06|nr:pyrroline-5-carboxylate reductase [Candidatus Planktophila lacus]ASY29538.1 pyrroline-5-carboxylate reductase [Candidatus Planktophila lacus]